MNLKIFLIFCLAVILFAVFTYCNWPWYLVCPPVLVLLGFVSFILYRERKKKYMLIFTILLLSTGLIIALIDLQLYLSYEYESKPTRPMDALIWNMGNHTHIVRLVVVDPAGNEIFNKSYAVNSGESIKTGSITSKLGKYSVIVEMDGKRVNQTVELWECRCKTTIWVTIREVGQETMVDVESRVIMFD